MKKPKLNAAALFTLPTHRYFAKGRGRDGRKFGKAVSDLQDGGKLYEKCPDAVHLQTAQDLTIDDYCQAFTQLPDTTGTAPELFGAARHLIGEIARRARNGDAKALGAYTVLAIMMSEGLSQMMVADPEVFRPIARGEIRWPLMRSTHPLNCDPDSLLKDIHLGTGAELQIDNFSKWHPDRAAQVAIHLMIHVKNLREHSLSKSLIPLPPFSKDSALDWWKSAEHCFDYSYRRPERVSGLAAIVTAQSKRKSPGRMRQKIKETIKARFLAMACPS